jgi:PAS domain S-box-containing protein
MDIESTLKLLTLFAVILSTVVLGLKAWYRKDWGMAGALLPRLYLIGALIIFFITQLELELILFYVGVFLVFTGDFISNLFIITSKRFHIEIYSLHLLEILKNLQSKYDFIIEHVPVGIYVLDSSGYIEFVNDAFCAITGYTKNELLGSSILKIIPEANKIMIQENIRLRIEGIEPTADYLTNIVSKNGKEIEIHISAKRTINGHPSITGCLIPVRR